MCRKGNWKLKNKKNWLRKHLRLLNSGVTWAVNFDFRTQSPLNAPTKVRGHILTHSLPRHCVTYSILNCFHSARLLFCCYIVWPMSDECVCVWRKRVNECWICCLVQDLWLWSDKFVNFTSGDDGKEWAITIKTCQCFVIWFLNKSLALLLHFYCNSHVHTTPVLFSIQIIV